ncbi:hypothetical protein N7474_000920 [Penicillium riverlandense]|uniref:uncharacterized protein n=1 Tax=Penicillium riverlandense TaxID=1903569 RepID=UPI0025496020|nr:uncharacterized protein N7474_000920 [Penicillium riverlandense]KAJ5832609.1 hypothetical protein N7474_000920 [Penicillium riverlandense]
MTSAHSRSRSSSSTRTTPRDHATQPETSPALAANLVQQCRTIIAEIDMLQTLLARTLRNPQLVEVRQLRSNVNSELKMLTKLEAQVLDSQRSVDKTRNGAGDGQLDPEVEMRLFHALRSSNLPFYQAVWNIAKGSCTGLLALGKRFYWDSQEPRDLKGEKQPNKDKRKSVFVDIVADDGEEWVKVSTVSESRLLFEMAKKGWERDSEEEDDVWSGSEDDGSRSRPPRRTVLRNFDGDEQSDGSDDDEDDLELIKLARDLRKAADATRVRYRHPRIRVVLPKVEEGNVPEINDLLEEIRKYDIQVECQGKISDAAAAQQDLAHLLPQPFKKFTDTLNVDCTLLLAMVSDLSHVQNMKPQTGMHKAIVRQLEVEKEQPLLPTELWPAMGAQSLICTEEAAARMREIVDTIGTDTEKMRARIVLGDPPYDHSMREALIHQFQKLSDYRVPALWKLPIKVADAQSVIDSGKGQLPRVADEVVKGLSDINHSVFMYGWVTGLTTISSNRTIDKQIEATIEKNRGGDDDLEGPSVWICETARSLVGKDKNRKP